MLTAGRLCHFVASALILCFVCICTLSDFDYTAAQYLSFLVSLSIPQYFPSASAQGGLFSFLFFCFSLVLGSDLITYLFSLSYSKLLWLRVLLRTDFCLPLPSSLQHSIQSLPHPLCMILYAICCLFAQVFPTLCLAPLSVLSYNFTLRRLCHFSCYLLYSLGQIALVLCNSLQGSLIRPPPCQVLYTSVSITHRADLRDSYGSIQASIYTLKLQSGPLKGRKHVASVV